MIERMLVIASMGIAGCASSSHVVGPLQKPAAPVSRAPEERHVYRVDFVVAANEPGKPAQSSAFTLNLEDYSNGELHLGSNIQINPQARQDVGLKITASLRPMTNDDLLLHDAVELSAVDGSAEGGTSQTRKDEPQTVHKITTSGDAYLHAGQQALVASLEDPLSHKRYQVSASATRLR